MVRPMPTWRREQARSPSLPFAAALKRAGFTRYVSAELGMQYVLNPEPIVASCLAWMRQTFI